MESDGVTDMRLQADLSCVWAWKALLLRDFTSVAEYQACVSSLPGLVLGARGARADLAQRVQ